jgi:multisubunit Na+/H+ antiporter MnhG subunit
MIVSTLACSLAGIALIVGSLLANALGQDSGLLAIIIVALAIILTCSLGARVLGRHIARGQLKIERSAHDCPLEWRDREHHESKLADFEA